jgi:hypothetical protein
LQHTGSCKDDLVRQGKPFVATTLHSVAAPVASGQELSKLLLKFIEVAETGKPPFFIQVLLDFRNYQDAHVIMTQTIRFSLVQAKLVNLIEQYS